jgi:glycine/D-amino acid oxidase-like deaminating enzyme
MTPLELPKSLWAATAPDPTAFPALVGEERADVCVVGGGFTGLSAALHLAEAGVSVVLVDAAEPGWGASGRNGGQVIAGLKLDPDALLEHYGPDFGPRVVALAGGTADFTFDLIRRHGIDCDAIQGGWIQGAPSAAGLAAVEARAEQWAARGAAVEVLSAAQAAQLIGHDYYRGALLDRRGGHIQPLSYSRGLAAAAARAGARIFTHAPVTGLIRDGARWRVATPAGVVVADRVILGTGGYTDMAGQGAPFDALAGSVATVFSYQIATRPLSDNLRRQIIPQNQAVSETRRLLIYYRLDRFGRLVIGGRGRFRDSGDPALYRHIERALYGLFPMLADQPTEYRWGGKIAMTRDHLPHLHEPAPGLTAGIGCNGRGVALATVMGKVLADHARGTPADDLDLPLSAIETIPLRALRRPLLGALTRWYRFRDWQERRAG